MEIGGYSVKPCSKKVWLEALIDKFPFPYLLVAILAGVMVYTAGILLSLVTDNLWRYISDFPWFIYSLYILIGTWVTPHYVKTYRAAFYSLRQMFAITDEEFEGLMGKFNKRLASFLSIPFSFIFLPILAWVSLNRLWWQEYNSVFLYDLYSGAIFIIILAINGVGIYIGCVAFNLNYHEMCEKVPLNIDFLLFDRFASLNKYFGSLCLKITIIYLVSSTLSNLPIIMLTKAQGAIMNFMIAITLTFIVFIIPQLLFHRLILKVKAEGKAKIQSLYRTFMREASERLKGDNTINERIYNMLGLVYLSVYRSELEEMREWLIDLRSISILITTLLLSTAITLVLELVLSPILSILS